MKNSVYATFATGTVSLVALLAASQVMAQTAPAADATSSVADDRGGIQDIVVTAQRKSETLQKVPISINVVSGDVLASRGVQTAFDLPNLVPGLVFVMNGGNGVPFIRGVGANTGGPDNESSVATYVDGVYISSTYATTFELANIERIEVLKGPQGTLFGRNATGGVIQVITRTPQQTPELQARIGYGNFGTITGAVYATTGLADGIAIDIAANGTDQRNGWGRNIAANADTYKSKNWSIRSKLLLNMGERLEATIAGDYTYLKSRMNDYRFAPGVRGVDGQLPPAGKYDTRTLITLNDIGGPSVTSKQHGFSLNLNYDLDFAQLVSISAYRKNTGLYLPEADGTPIPFVEAILPIFQRNYSQEIQLLSPKGSAFDWTIGGFYFNNNAGFRNYTFGGLAFGNPATGTYGTFAATGQQNVRSKSVYAQGTVEVLPGTKLTGGIRYTDETLKAQIVIPGLPLPRQSGGFKKATWRVALDHAFSSDINTYVSYNRGIKSGGFDLLSPGSPGYDPEQLDAYEVGIKSKLLNNTLRFNAALFYYDYKNIQVQIIPTGGGGIAQTTNAAKARMKGLDVDFQFAPTREILFSGGFAMTDGKYKDFRNAVSYFASPLQGGSRVIDASGNRTVYTPKFAGNLTAAYRVFSDMGEFPLSLSVSHNSGFFFGSDNRAKQSSYTLLNGSTGWTSNNQAVSVTLWGRNLTNKYYLSQLVPSGLGDLTSPAAPRTYGITLSTKLGG